jgi:hypothetical protein
LLLALALPYPSSLFCLYSAQIYYSNLILLDNTTHPNPQLFTADFHLLLPENKDPEALTATATATGTTR